VFTIRLDRVFYRQLETPAWRPIGLNVRHKWLVRSPAAEAIPLSTNALAIWHQARSLLTTSAFMRTYPSQTGDAVAGARAEAVTFESFPNIQI
jgi:hypothetical protein